MPKANATPVPPVRVASLAAAQGTDAPREPFPHTPMEVDDRRASGESPRLSPIAISMIVGNVA